MVGGNKEKETEIKELDELQAGEGRKFQFSNGTSSTQITSKLQTQKTVQ